MMLRVTTYTKHRGRYSALTDRMEYTANVSDHGRLDLAAQAVRRVHRVSAPCMRVQVGYQTFDVSYIAGNLVLDRNLLPRHKADGSPYPLSRTRARWIHYIDLPGHRYCGEWNTYTARKEAVRAARQWEVAVEVEVTQ